MGVNVAFGFAGRAVYARRFMATDTPQPSPADVVLVRGRGRACARLGGGDAGPTRFLTGSIEWGYHGAGPARLAQAILRTFCSADDARRLSSDFKREVVARVPHPGATLEAAFIRAWLASHTKS